MTDFLSAGVFIEEREPDLQVIQSVSPSVAAFVGFTPRGPANTATLVTSLPEANSVFGGVTRKGRTGYMLTAFFANGGSRAYVVRVVPSDAVTADAKARSATYDQQIETGATGTSAFSKTAGASVLKDNGGVSPLVPSSVTFRYRSAGPAVASQGARTRSGSAALVLANGTRLYEGRLDPKATFLVSGTGANGGVYYRSVSDYGTDVQVTHVNAGASQTLAVTVSGRRVTVRLATDGSAIITSTAAAVAAAILASEAASALLTATATGSGLGLAGAREVVNLRGIPALDPSLEAVVPGSLTLTWTASGVPKSVAFTGLTTTPTQTASNGAGSIATLDLRTGRFTLICHASEAPDGTDAGVSITAAYTPATVVRTLADDGSGALTNTAALTAPGTIGYDDGSYSFTCRTGAAATASLGSGTNGTVNITLDLNGALGNEYSVAVTVPSGTSPLTAILNGTELSVALDVTAGVPTVGANTATLVAAAIAALPGLGATASGTGASELPGAEGPTSFSGGVDPYSPHDRAPVLASYEIDAWTMPSLAPGACGNLLRCVVAGDPLYYDAATATYSRYRLTLYLIDETTGALSPAESYDELVFDDPTHPFYWADVINALSDNFRVTEPGADEPLGQLNGRALAVVLGGGDETTGGQTFSGSVPGPIAARSITITYTDSTGTVRRITDNGFGVLTGSVDPAYATVVSGLNPNRINATTGAYNFRTLYPVMRGSLVSFSGRTTPAETAHTETFGDTAKGYTAGDDGTFTSTTYGRNQISEPTTLSPTNQGLYALNTVDEILQVVVPDFAGDVTVAGDQIDYAESRASSQPSGGDRFVILTVPAGSSAQEADDWVNVQLNKPTKFAAVYWPWVKIRDPLADNRLTPLAPLGHVAGIYARTDHNRNVGKSPAGTVDGQLQYVAELERNPSQGERDFVYPRKINPLRADRMVGRAVWGARTLSASSAWRYINAVRLFMFVEKAIYESTHWIAFENNGPALWSRIRLQVEGYLSSLFVDGYFAGTTRAEAYSLVCDGTNNPQSVIDAGQVVIDIALAPNKPAEFARFRFTQRSLAA